MKLSIKTILFVMMFSVMMSGCNMTMKYTDKEIVGYVSGTSQCTRSNCSYTLDVDGMRLFLVSQFPVSMRQPVNVTIRTYEDGSIEYKLPFYSHIGQNPSIKGKSK